MYCCGVFIWTFDLRDWMKSEERHRENSDLHTPFAVPLSAKVVSVPETGLTYPVAFCTDQLESIYLHLFSPSPRRGLPRPDALKIRKGLLLMHLAWVTLLLQNLNFLAPRPEQSLAESYLMQVMALITSTSTHRSVLTSGETASGFPSVTPSTRRHGHHLIRGQGMNKGRSRMSVYTAW